MPETVIFKTELLDTHLVVDARTPLEYAEDHLPGAINVPLLSNDERVEIGILHKETGPHAARRRGLELTAQRFPAMVEEIAAAAAGRPILVYCWRGGLRSKTVATILELTGFPAIQLFGGYKAFRNQVSACFEPFTPPGPLVVLHGMTGIGKTTLLGMLPTDRWTVIDLERLACHRGSAFGSLGLSQEGLSQKRFETILWESFRKSPPGQAIILEGESKRIGRLSLPGDMYETMHRGIKIWCEASMATRVSRLIDEYGRQEYRQGMAEALKRIRKKLGGDNYREIAGYLERWELGPFMEGLMRNYYDKIYYKTREWQEEAVITLDDLDVAGRQLDAFLQQRLG